jgi:phage-related protein
MRWTVLFANATAEAELNALPEDMQMRFGRIARLIAESGLIAMREPYVKHLTGKLWEMRITGRDGIARSIYVTASDQRVIVLRTFVKKTQQTPQREIALAIKRMKEILE